jgi:cobalamin biosynthesis Mg chelatase CobN
MLSSRSRAADDVDRRRRTHVIASGLAGTGMVLMLAGVGAGPAHATQDHDDEGHKVTICHATSADENPYVEQEVDVASILDDQGHADHVGPLWVVDHPKHEDWGDIIPAFDFGEGEQFDGLNLPAGQLFLDDHCALPGTTTSSSSTSTTEASTTSSSTSTTEASTTSSSTSTTEASTTSSSTSTTEAPTTTSTAVEETTTQPTVILDAFGTAPPTIVADALGLPRTGASSGLLMSAGSAFLVAAVATLRLARRANPA